MTTDELIKRLHRYSENCVAYKLDADFADAVQQAADAIERLSISQKNADSDISFLLAELRDCRNELCQKCEAFHYSSEGACNGCRWSRGINNGET